MAKQNDDWQSVTSHLFGALQQLLKVRKKGVDRRLPIGAATVHLLMAINKITGLSVTEIIRAVDPSKKHKPRRKKK